MTRTADLTRVSHRHDPELAHAEGIESPIEAVAVGWLGDRVPSTGALDGDLLEALEHCSRYHYLDGGELGLHTCEICHGFDGRGEMLIETPGDRYLLPQLVLHYIADHDYRPPDVFLRDLLQHWRSPQASRCRTNSCGAVLRLPCVEPAAEGPQRDADREELILLVKRLREEGVDPEEIEARLRQWVQARVAAVQDTIDLDAIGTAPEPAPGKTLVDRRRLRNRNVGPAGHAVSVIFRILNLTFPVVLLAGVVWFLYRLMA